MQRFIAAALIGAMSVISAAGPVSAASAGPVIAQAQSAQGTITGRVTDQSGRPVAGAAIVANGPASASATSGSDGGFRLAVQPGVYVIVISKSGFRQAQTDDVVVPAGASVAIAPSLTAADVSSLVVIGRTSANRTAPININSSPITTISSAQIQQRESINLNDQLQELPGITINNGAGFGTSTTPNSSIVVRGSDVETRVNIDGHPLSAGAFNGQWNSNYGNSMIFQNVEVVKGAGLNGTTAGESGIGTVNLRTRDFTGKTTYGFNVGNDGYNGGQYSFFGEADSSNGKYGILFARAYSAFGGPYDNYFGNRLNQGISGSVGVPYTNGTFQPASNYLGTILSQADFTNRFTNHAELTKVRVNLSSATQLTLEELGLYGRYEPQGGSYAGYYGTPTVAACYNPTQPKPGTATNPLPSFTYAATTDITTCGAASSYNAPYLTGLIGKQVQAYAFFPGSRVTYNEPEFAAELRTTFKNDTIFLRPYAGSINRLVFGGGEPGYAGNVAFSFANGTQPYSVQPGWYPVTSSTNCTVGFRQPLPSIAGAPAIPAQGPCFPASAASATNNTPIVVDPTTPRAFNVATPGAGFSCSPTPPYTCWTTPTQQNNAGVYGFGTPFNQPEVDKLNGFTFLYVHPVGDNTYTFSWDQSADSGYKLSGDTTPAAPGCTLVVGSTVNPAVGTPGNQPNCPGINGGFLPRTGLVTPLTLIRHDDFSLTGTFQLTPKLTASMGNYFTRVKTNAQLEDPNLLLSYVPNQAATPVSLIQSQTIYTHYDPHFAFTYRPNVNTSVRLTGGSSISTPFVAQVSGVGRVTQPDPLNPNVTITQINPGLKPETTISYDLGADVRTQGGVFSGDVYYTNIFNVFVNQLTQIANLQSPTPLNGGATYNSQLVNGPLKRNYGLELTYSRLPQIGFGYRASTSFERSFYDLLPPSFYFGLSGAGQSQLNGAQLYGIPYNKAYLQLQYAGVKTALVELDGDYEGNNNSTGGAPYVQLNGSIRFGIGNGFSFLLSAENVTNVNVGNAYGRGTFGEANRLNTLRLTPAGTFVPGFQTQSLQGIPPRAIRMSISKNMF